MVAEGNGAPFEANFGGSAPAAPAAGEACSEACVAIYPYVSDEPGDLTFEAGDAILVTAKAGDWWTGETQGRWVSYQTCGKPAHPAPCTLHSGLECSPSTTWSPRPW